jgi:two-component system phosphate regulon sensor histidine kinase PhoR
MQREWRTRLLWQLAGLSLLTFLAGLLSGHFWMAMALVATLACAVDWYHQIRLLQWLQGTGGATLPRARGPWGLLYGRLEEQKKQHNSRIRDRNRVIIQMRTGVNAMSQGVLMINDRDRLVWWNDAAGRLLGLSRHKDRNNLITNLIRTPEFVSYYRSHNYGQPLKMPSRLHEHRMLEAEITYYDENARMLLLRDITGLTRLETIRSDFAANLAHELKTPLTLLQGYAEMLATAEMALPEPAREAFDQIQRQSERMDALIRDMLVLSRIETQQLHLEMNPVDMVRIVRAVGGELMPLAEAKDVRLQVMILNQASVHIRGSENLLRTALMQLVENAIKYSPPCSRVSLIWGESYRGVYVSVKDNGPGIPAAHIPRLTERFYRVDNSRNSGIPGSGLGLAIVKHVVSLHSGRLDITSRVGVGSTFTCTFLPYEAGRVISAEGGQVVDAAPDD